ncbi:MAG: hypothetical protein JWL69_2492 [Phycisphaerales bacterium]|nr:hypothetical protein [Phycisphaerales bacterium]
MNSPAVGIGFYFWLRFRWIVGGMLAYLLALAVVARIPRVHASPDFALAIVGLLTLPLAIPFVYLVHAFTYGPTDLAARTSGFPRHMLSLPASARALAGWPMLIASVTIGAIWALTAGLVLNACGVGLPVLWPAFLAGAVIAWIQAIAWAPFPFPIGRAVVLVPIILGLIVGGLYASSLGVSSIVIAAGFAALALLAHALAARGVAHFRLGEGNGNGLAESLRRRVFSTSDSQSAVQRRPKPPFRSPAAAQLWYERRRNVAFLPGMTAFTCIAMFVPLVKAARATNIPRCAIGPFDVPVPIFGLGACLVSMYAISGMAGGGLGKSDYWGKIAQWPAFLTTRPLPTTDFVLAKLKAAAISTAIACAILFGFASLGSILTPNPFDRSQSLAAWAMHHVTPRLAMYSVAGMILFIFGVWRNQVGGLFLPLSGRLWFMTTFGVIPSLLFLLVMGLGGVAAYRYPVILPIVRRVVPWVFLAVAAINLAVGVVLSIALRRTQMMQPRTIAILAAGWLMTVVSLLAILHAYIGAHPVLIPAVLLLLPVTRLAAAPLALRWNRHR